VLRVVVNAFRPLRKDDGLDFRGVNPKETHAYSSVRKNRRIMVQFAVDMRSIGSISALLHELAAQSSFNTHLVLE
jgi:hypothetical protein